jgi:hypothetical protein
MRVRIHCRVDAINVTTWLYDFLLEIVPTEISEMTPRNQKWGNGG